MRDDSLILGQLAEEFTARVRQRQMPDIEDYAGRHPELAERIRALFPTLLLLEGLAAGQATLGPEQSLPSLADIGPGVDFGNYRIDGEIGRGGMGAVYAATHLALGKRVALKILPIQGPREAGTLERFLREARTAAGLHHTNIVPVFDVGQVNGIPYYAMQLIEGRSLDKVIGGQWPVVSDPVTATGDWQPDAGRDDVTKKVDGPAASSTTSTRTDHRPMTTDHYFRRVAEWGIQAAEGLAHAHQRGVIHRDIKPSNLILDKQNVLWITDFGLARRLEDPSLTHSGTIVGTPRYMSPEQAEAARSPIDHRTDIYSLGATLYEMLTCRPAFDGPTPLDIVMQIISRDPPPARQLNRAIPRDLETIVEKAMSKTAADRYRTAAELGEDLRRYLQMEPIKARRTGPMGRTVRWCRRNPRLAWVTGVAAVIILTLSGFYYASLLDRIGALEREKDALGQVQAATKDAAAARLEANQEQARVQVLREQALDSRARFLFEEARAMRTSSRPGRRADALKLLAEAEKLCGRVKPAGLTADPVSDLSRAELRTETLAALMTPQLALVRELEFGTNVSRTLFSANGQRVLTTDFTVEKPVAVLLDLPSGKKLHTWTIPSAAALLALSPDGQRVAGIVSEGQGAWHVGLAQVGSIEQPSKLPLPNAPKGKFNLFNLIFSADGQHLIGAGANSGEVWIVHWQLSSGKVQTVHKGPLLLSEERRGGASDPGPIVFSGNSKRLAFFTAENRITLWDLEKGEAARQITLPLSGSGEIAFGPRDELLAVICRLQPGNQTLLLWDLVHNDEHGRLLSLGETWGPRVAFHPVEEHLAVSDGMGGSLIIVDARARRELLRLPSDGARSVFHLQWQANTQHLLVEDMDGNFGNSTVSLKVWEFTKATALATLPFELPAVDKLFAFSPDDQWLAVKGSQKVQLIRRDNGKLAKELDMAQVSQLQFRADSRQLVCVGKSIRIFDVPDGNLAAEPAVQGKLLAAAFTPSGQLLILSRHGDKEYLLADAAGKIVWKKPIQDKAHAPQLSPDGRYLLDDQLTLWSVAGNTMIIVNTAPLKESIGKSLFGSDAHFPVVLKDAGRFLVLPSPRSQSTVNLWNKATGDSHEINVPALISTSCVFSPGGSLLAIGTVAGRVHVWNVERRQELFSYEAHDGVVEWLQFTPDGSFLASASHHDSRIRMFDLGAFAAQSQQDKTLW